MLTSRNIGDICTQEHLYPFWRNRAPGSAKFYYKAEQCRVLFWGMLALIDSLNDFSET